MHQFNSYAALDDVLAHQVDIGVIDPGGLGRGYNQRRAKPLASRTDEMACDFGQKWILGRGGFGQGLFDPAEGFLQTRKMQSLDDVHSGTRVRDPRTK